MLDDEIIIPPELFFQPPPSTPEADHYSSSSTIKEDQNKNLNFIIAIAGMIAGSALIFAIMIIYCLIRDRRRVGNIQRYDSPPLTQSSSDLSAGSSRRSVNDLERNVSTNNSTRQLDTQHDTCIQNISKNHAGSSSSSRNGEKLNCENNLLKQSSSTSPSSAPPPPAPAFKPKAPPPPPKVIRPPPAPLLGAGKGPRLREGSTLLDGTELSGDCGAPRTKLKPFFWDKVVSSPNHSMVWDEIKEGSFQFNEERIESLFSYNADNKTNSERHGQTTSTSQPQQIQIIDPKKSQNLSILLKALNVTTEEVCGALLEGNELPTELLQTLLRMAPTQDEELKLRLFYSDLSLLGPAERFLKVVVDIPLAFKRMESLMFMMTYKEEVTSIKEAFVTLEVACDELKESRLFLKLLEAVLKTGNRMNDGTYRGGAQAIKLDTLLKLADVKGTDGKTTLLHFVVQEIIRAEGLKAIRSRKRSRSISSMESEDFIYDSDFHDIEEYQTFGLQRISELSSELENVKKAAIIDADGLTTSVSKLGQSLTKIKNFLNNEMDNSEQESGFYLTLVQFRDRSECEVEWLVKEEQRISELVRKTADYFHGNAGKEEGLRLFSIVREFLIMLDRICAQLKDSISKPIKPPDDTEKNASPTRSSHDPQQSIHDMRERLFPMIPTRCAEDFSSDSDSE
ncbi:hypothetical protein vseg_017691 [Gypsophila vaccaria]